MAATKSHRYLGGGGARITSTDLADQTFEFDEADVWRNTNQPETRRSISKPRPLRKPLRKTVDDVDRAPIRPNSLPVNIPDWSKILRGEYKPRACECTDEEDDDDDDDDDDDVGNDRMAPHEYLARTRVASLSVHEGIGRTLKGRDLSSLRNAIWKKTGFEA